MPASRLRLHIRRSFLPELLGRAAGQTRRAGAACSYGTGRRAWRPLSVGSLSKLSRCGEGSGPPIRRSRSSSRASCELAPEDCMAACMRGSRAQVCMFA